MRRQGRQERIRERTTAPLSPPPELRRVDDRIEPRVCAGPQWSVAGGAHQPRSLLPPRLSTSSSPSVPPLPQSFVSSIQRPSGGGDVSSDGFRGEGWIRYGGCWSHGGRRGYNRRGPRQRRAAAVAGDGSCGRCGWSIGNHHGFCPESIFVAPFLLPSWYKLGLYASKS